MSDLDKFYLGGERKRIIDTYFDGIENSTEEFNNKVYKKWLQERKEKRNRVISWIFAIVGIILAVITLL